MAATELSNRLECLTSFSSQLVFVCTDKIKQQSQVIESFIGQQGEKANIALITANELTPLASYRQTLFHQLISTNQQVNFHLPLNQLLANLNEHDGPILISIFHADKLPTKLVKEIWELVLQSRFARNKQQLNVLLMGHSDWAENAKKSLFSRSKEKPIVLNGTNTAEIELISKPIKKVSLTQPKSRLPLSSQPSSSPLKKGPVILFLILAFLTVFAGLLSWLYFDQISEIWLNKVTPITEIQQTQNEAKNNTAVSAQSLTEIKSEAVPLQIAAQLSDTQKNMQIQEPLRGDAINVGSELLVADWHSANATNNMPKEVQNLIVIEDVKVTAPPLTQEANQVTIDKPTPPIQTDGEKQQALATVINDYPIAVNSVPSQTIDEKPETLSQSTVYLDYSEQLLLGLPSNKYVIQIAAMSNFNLLQEYAFDNQLTQKVWLYKTQRYGAAWYVLLANESYADLESARANIEQLPGTMREYVPFVKVLSQVQQEISVN